MLNEQKKTIINENNLVERDELTVLRDRIKAYYEPDAPKNVLQSVVGLAGVGKSVLLEMLLEDFKKNSDYSDMFFCRIDISDCADEIDIYFKIASQLEHYYMNSSVASESDKRQALKQFMTIHGWIYGNAGKYPTTVSGNSSSDTTTVTKDVLEQLSKNFQNNEKSEIKDTTIGKLDIVFKLLDKVMDMIPYVQLGKVLVDLSVESNKKYQLKKLLEEYIDVFNSKVKREEVLRKLLVMAMPKEENRKLSPVIILDNFQLLSTGELGRDHTWLIKSDGLIGSIDAYWIIAGRLSVLNCFKVEQYFDEIQKEIQLQGFEKDQAQQYIENRCDNYFSEKDPSPELKKEVIEKMLSVCGMHGHNFAMNTQIDEMQIYYPPYLLNLVANHFCKLCADPAYNITVDSFVGLNTKEEFIGYYFYKDLSDLMTNAFQILSCLPTWDDKWIEIVRERFDNHLLNAKTVLFKTAPMENIGEGRFKLHEGIRDGLFNVGTNYIKYDVLKYLYEKFIDIYGSDMTAEQKDFWYQPERLQTFMECVYQYINLSDVKKEERFEEIKPCVYKIYKANEARGNVTESFIRFYSKYIDNIRTTFDIPFVDLVKAELSDENMEKLECELKNAMKDKLPDMKWMVYFMECCFKLSDMYTNLNRSSAAYNLEKLGIIFWKNIEERTSDKWEENCRCRQQLSKQINAYAFDNSQEQNYSVAYESCREGLKVVNETIEKILGTLDDESKNILRIFINPEASEEFIVESHREINQEIFSKLKKAYQLLVHWRSLKDNDSSEKDIKTKKILAEMIMVEYRKLRGNYPWYSFHVAQPDMNGQQCVEFGVRTYWMRRAFLEVLEEKKHNKREIMGERANMIISYHNVCVYLYKSGNVQDACLLEHEVIEEGNMILPPAGNLRVESQNRINDIKNNIQKKTAYGIFEYLWQSIVKDIDEVKILNKHNQILENMQYVGDYYLHMRYYTLAYRQFSYVSLCRYIRFGLEDNKTLDSLQRLYVAAVILNRNDDCRMIKECVEENLFNHSDREKWKDSKKGLTSKVDCLEHLIKISDEVEENIAEKMLDVLDEKK